MFPFWESAIAPIVSAVQPRCVLEIGVPRGGLGGRLLHTVVPTAEVHVIDPRPQPGPADKAHAVSDRCHLHRGRSLDVLPDLPPMDIALINGDHNWFTVLRELQSLSATARAAGQPLPVLILHNVGWPYGRRDAYLDPDAIPMELRQPFAQGGLQPDRDHLLDSAGLNDSLNNAEVAGGPRNGVMTALEDFTEEYDRPLVRLVLPFFFGLAVVAESERVRDNPELASVLEHLTSAEGREDLLEIAERIRVDAAVSQHDRSRLLTTKVGRGAERYLELVKAAVLDEHYIDNEVRLEYMASVPPGGLLDEAALRDPPRLLPVRFQRLTQARRAGRSTDGVRNLSYFPYTDMGRPQLDSLHEMLRAIRAEDVPGDLAECGVGRGGGGIFLRAFLAAYEMDDRQVWMVDPFRASASDADDNAGGPAGRADTLARFRADLNQVQDGFARFDLLDARVRFVQGAFDDVLQDAPIEQLALLRVGAGLGESLGPVLRHLLPRVSVGGVVIVEGLGDARVEKTLATVREQLGVTSSLDRIDWNSARWRVDSASPAPAIASRAATPHRVALVPARPPEADRVALTVVVVFYNMRREAARTLLSLSRSYQQGVEDLDYEVIVVDNGSAPDERLQDAEVQSYGPEFRLLDLGDTAQPSPTVALNRGIAEARGDAVALMIDGAHVLTPGVLRLGMTALRTYAPAIVATQQWYVGPGQQGDALQGGYDQVAEDRLFRRIKWPTDGYRLFEIGHFIGDRDWFDGIVESNCLFVPRSVLEQIGGFDDSFSMPGGGYANLDLFERLGCAPQVNAASILGEGSFHQVHGGTTTNVVDVARRRDLVFSYGEHFQELRGRSLVGLSDPVHYVGSMATKAARRTRSRRQTALAFNPLRDPVDSGDPASTDAFVPDELKLAAIEAVWNHQAWKETTWLGHPVCRYPTDLHSYQELLVAVSPAHAIVIGDDAGLGGRALFAASVFDQLGHGQVIAVGTSEASDRPKHDRIIHVVGPAESAAVAAEVTAMTGAPAAAAVFLGLGAVHRVIAAFELYAPLVPPGSYVVVENTVVNGRPVVSGFGPGPHEAVVNILERHRDFMGDPSFERYTLTFNRNGFLKRVR